MPYVRLRRYHSNMFIYLIYCIAFSFDGEIYDEIDKSRYQHHWTLGLANYRGRALTTGCNSFGDCKYKTELLSLNTLKWSDGPDFPYTDWFPGDTDK